MIESGKYSALSVGVAIVAVTFLFGACEVTDSEREEAEKTVVPYTEGIRIAWDFRTLTKVFGGPVSYPRIIRLQNGTLLAAFESEGAVYLSRSNDEGENWSDAELTAPADGEVISAVPELIQLENGNLLIAYNTRPPQDNQNPDRRFGIKLRISSDGGNTWSSQQNIFEGGFEWNRGVWEPVMIQLDSGEIQLFFANEFPYENSEDQEISMVRSFDNGETWSDPETISYREGHRDGMPVPLILDDEEGIAVAIEDNGLHGSEFKPSIIWSSIEDNWEADAARGDSERRWGALNEESQLPASDYGGAPYLEQLSSGETILSFQSTEGRNVEWNRSTMTVAIGDRKAQNFSRKSKPFEVPEERSALWNSLFIKNDTTVTAVASTNAYNASQTELYSIDGYVNKQMKAHYRSVDIDGVKTDEVWNKATTNFIGAYSPANAHVSAAWDDSHLYFFITVNDSNVVESLNSVENSPGITVMVASGTVSSDSLVEGLYKIVATPSAKVSSYKGKNGNWISQKLKVDISSADHSSGYRLEIAIPWSEIEGVSENKEAIGFNFQLRSNSESGYLNKEGLSGNSGTKPSTWTKIELIK